MNEQILIPYVGSFLSLFLLAISFSFKTKNENNYFFYATLVLSLINIFISATLGADQIFLLLNAGIALGALFGSIEND
jgi:hypothetical protein